MNTDFDLMPNQMGEHVWNQAQRVVIEHVQDHVRKSVKRRMRDQVWEQESRVRLQVEEEETNTNQ